MAMKTLTFLSVLLPAVLARPWEDSPHLMHRHLHTGGHTGPFPSGTAPFPAGNHTNGGATGTGTACSSVVTLSRSSTSHKGQPVYITSTLEVVPQPVTTDVYASTGGPGGHTGNNSPGQQGPGKPGNEGPNGPNSPNTCPAGTVTVTAQPTTVYVTVTASETPGSNPHGPGQPGNTRTETETSTHTLTTKHSLPPSSLPPFPTSHNETSAVGTGTGTGAPVVPETPSPKPVEVQTPKHKGAEVVHKPAAPVVPGPAYTPPAVYTPANTHKQSKHQSAGEVAPKPKHKSSSTGPKGVIYNDANKARSMDVSWACNWGQTSGVQNPSWEYVPQLWGPKMDFGSTIASNAASFSNVLFYNEPDIPTDQGGCGVGVEQAVSDWHTYMSDLKKAGKSVSGPCVANSNSDYLDQFLSAFPKGTIDILCFHWYGPEIEGLKQTVDTFKGLADKHGCSEVWITEMAVMPPPSDLSEYTSYLDGAVDRYAYNLNNLGSASY